jgi:SAM-dependent methyltransferase
MISASFLRPFSRVSVPVKMLANRFPRFNAAMWNMQYRLGMWNGIDSATGAQVIALLEKYTVKPNILDLGCGKSTNLHLDRDKYCHYHGVDISLNSIRAAREHACPNASFEVADILRYDTNERYDAILLREVLYYLPKHRIADFLRRITRFLELDGKILIQFWDKSACREYVEMVLASGLRVLEEQIRDSSNSSESTVIVLQGLASIHRPKWRRPKWGAAADAVSVQSAKTCSTIAWSRCCPSAWSSNGERVNTAWWRQR